MMNLVVNDYCTKIQSIESAVPDARLIKAAASDYPAGASSPSEPE
jgi:hypothetical protein